MCQYAEHNCKNAQSAGLYSLITAEINLQQPMQQMYYAAQQRVLNMQPTSVHF